MADLLNKLLAYFKQKPRIAILMSGTGSNAEAILKNADIYPNLKFITIFSDHSTSNALMLSKKYHLQHYCLELSANNYVNRETYFSQVADYFLDLKIDLLLYAGFMKITPPFFIQAFPGINIHPSDLTILNALGKPKYTGMHAVKEAVNHGEKYIASTAHVVDIEVDCGQPLLISKRLYITNYYQKDYQILQNTLKIHCEHLLYPKLLELLSKNLLTGLSLPLHWHQLSEKPLFP